jgi:hypothetical protein
MFGGLPWYESLSKPEASGITSAWYVARDTDPEWSVCLLEAALRYAEDKDLWDVFRQRFEGISVGDVSLARANAENWEADFNIWEIATELVVAAYLEHSLGWTFRSYEPLGNAPRRGDWEFISPSRRRTFVEVKTVCEAQWRPISGGSFRPSHAARISSLLARAYRQLPDDDRSTLVVIVGTDLVQIPFGVMHGDLFASLFGQFVVKFNVMTPRPEITFAGPSFREMLVGHTKRRRLGAVAGLVLRGLSSPAPLFYSIHNPFAHAGARLDGSDFGDCPQFVWTEATGTETGRNNADNAWQRIRSALVTSGPCAQVA